MTALRLLRILAIGGLLLALPLTNAAREQRHQEDGGGTSAAPPASIAATMKRIIESYQQATQRTSALHQQSWNRLVVAEKDVRIPEAAKPGSGKQTSGGEGLVKNKPWFPLVKGLKTNIWGDHTHESAKPGDASQLPPFVEDDENYIDGYFEVLTERCSQNATMRGTEFLNDCFGSVLSLIKSPRCTTQFDSRYVCKSNSNGDEDSNDETPETKATSLAQNITAKDLIREHFTDSTLNVVIVGAGPVGLYVANVLQELQIQAETAQSADRAFESLRILMFDNATQAPGRKVYTDDWLTDIPLDLLQTTDERIYNLLTTLHHKSRSASSTADDTPKHNVRVPIFVLQALLVISNRDNGVKYLYEDFAKYKNMLANYPNLLVIDASGHSMEPLTREGPSPSDATKDGQIKLQSLHSSRGVTVSSWKPHETCAQPSDAAANSNSCAWGSINKDQYDFLKQNGHVIHIANRTSRQGAMLYPVSADTNQPFHVRYLNIHDIFPPAVNEHFIKSWKMYGHDLMISNHPLCLQQTCAIDENLNCDDLCRLSWLDISTSSYRHDIAKLLARHRPAYPVVSASLQLTQDQFDAFRYILTTPGDDKPAALALYDIEPADMVYQRLFQTNNLIHTLRLFAAWCVPSRPLVSVHTYTPYIYENAVLPRKARSKARIGDAPVLRVGESFLSGNPHQGGGMVDHLTILQDFKAIVTGHSIPNAGDEVVEEA